MYNENTSEFGERYGRESWRLCGDGGADDRVSGVGVDNMTQLRL